MRTDDEILARIEAIKESDWMGTQVGDLVMRLPFEKAQAFLNDDAKKAGSSDWVPMPRDRAALIAEMLDYMPFAWGKANGCRGLSAGRSMDHYAAWTWLAGDDFGDLTDYKFYGKGNLCEICERYGWNAKIWDDGKLVIRG